MRKERRQVGVYGERDLGPSHDYAPDPVLPVIVIRIYYRIDMSISIKAAFSGLCISSYKDRPLPYNEKSIFLLCLPNDGRVVSHTSSLEGRGSAPNRSPVSCGPSRASTSYPDPGINRVRNLETAQ